MAIAAIIPGKVAPRQMLINIGNLVSSYYNFKGKLAPVEFGTSGHRGSAFKGSFNEAHILATTQAICDYRKANSISGPLFIGFDTHALSLPAFKTALQVLAANGVEVRVHKNDEYTPTPVISHQILQYNKGRVDSLADGIVITPSHNGPQDGGFKYNPTNGGPADVDITNWVQKRANELMDNGNRDVISMGYEEARKASTTQEKDFMTDYVNDLGNVIDMDIIRQKKIRIGVDPLGGSAVHYWKAIAQRFGLDITVVNEKVDPTFGFMTVDTDKTIRMDCSSPDAMASLIGLKNDFQIAFAQDPDGDRHGIVCPTGLMNPNHYLSVAIWYLFQNRPDWPQSLKVGKTAVSSSIIDRVVKGLNRDLYEVPVGFKWFVEGLSKGWLGFGGEESAGASFLRMDGSGWTTDKDGIILSLLSAEILAKTGQTPAEIYDNVLVPKYGKPYYRRVDGPINDDQKAILKGLTNEAIMSRATHLAGKKIVNVLFNAPGNGSKLGGVKVEFEDGSWFAIRPSGTEPKMKFYIESFGGEDLWAQIRDQAPEVVFGQVA